MIYPMKLAPALKDYIWGGRRLITEYHKKTYLTDVAESWEISCHREGLCHIVSGELAGSTLASFVAEHPDVVGEAAKGLSYFPLIVKLLDAAGDLSVQVHPNSEYARYHEVDPGKTELWYILDAEPGASILYGFSKKISREECRRRIEDNTLLEVISRVQVHKGDVVFIPPGTLHAIGKGILLAEVQQSSNITYRLYDYGRLGRDGRPRELHVDKALDVLNFTPPPYGFSPQAVMTSLLSGADIKQLIRCEHFAAYAVELRNRLELTADRDSFHTLTMLSGEMEISVRRESLPLVKGETVFIPAGLGEYVCTGQGEFILSKL